MGTVENQQGQDVDDGWVRDRKREFEELIDANRDGIVTAAELEVGVGPAALGSGVGLAGRWGGKAARRWTRFLPRECLHWCRV